MSLKKPETIIKYILLHLINEEDSYGYGIIKKIEEISGGYWEPSYGTIYGALSRLEKKGYLKRVEKNHEERKYFTITKKGKEKLLEYESSEEEINKKLKDIILGLLNLYDSLMEKEKHKKLLKEIKEEINP